MYYKLHCWQLKQTKGVTMKYEIVRIYKDNKPSVVMFKGFTLDRAKKHCKNMHDCLETFGWMDVYEKRSK